MVVDFVLDEEFFSSLTELDAEIARQVASAGCRFCGGRLHQANYQRKPRGGLLAMAGETFPIRHSLCCGAQGCRKRSLPPSLRFFGRRVYLEAVVVFASMLSQLCCGVRGASERSGVPRSTLRRWGAWWREGFLNSRIWAELRARFEPPPPVETDLPRSLVQRIGEELSRLAPPPIGEVCRLVALLLSPATTSSVPDGSRFVRGFWEGSRPG